MLFPKDIKSRLVTMDKNWLYHYDPETKQQSMEWRHSGLPLPAPKNSECKNSLEKFSPASIFCVRDCILLIDYFPKGQIINAEYYSSLLVQLKEKRRGKFNNGVWFLHENAPAHRALTIQKNLVYLCFQCLDYQPYSLDLVPSDNHLFLD